MARPPTSAPPRQSTCFLAFLPVSCTPARLRSEGAHGTTATTRRVQQHTKRTFQCVAAGQPGGKPHVGTHARPSTHYGAPDGETCRRRKWVRKYHEARGREALMCDALWCAVSACHAKSPIGASAASTPPASSARRSQACKSLPIPEDGRPPAKQLARSPDLRRRPPSPNDPFRPRPRPPPPPPSVSGGGSECGLR